MALGERIVRIAFHPGRDALAVSLDALAVSLKDRVLAYLACFGARKDRHRKQRIGRYMALKAAKWMVPESRKVIRAREWQPRMEK
jgi:hypothetical protein